MTFPVKRSDAEKLRESRVRRKRGAGLVFVFVLVFGAAGCSSAAATGVGREAPTHEAQVSGTDARLIAVSAVSDRIVWVSGARGTWLRTTDGGATWRGGRVAGADTLQFRDVEGVDSSTAYLLSIGPGEQSRIYKTTDGGANWLLMLKNSEPAGFFDCFSFWDAAHGIAVGDAIGHDVFVITTEDGGAHWTRIPPSELPSALEGEGSFAASGTCVTTRPGGLAWFVSNNKDHARVLKTADFGKHWSVTALPVTTRDGVGAQSVAFYDNRRGVVLSGGYASQARDTGAAITADGGATWTVVTRPPLAIGVWGGAYARAARAPMIVAVGPSGAVWSDDSGRSWTAIDSLNYWSVGFSPAGAGWAVGEGGRITKLEGAHRP